MSQVKIHLLRNLRRISLVPNGTFSSTFLINGEQRNGENSETMFSRRIDTSFDLSGSLSNFQALILALTCVLIFRGPSPSTTLFTELSTRALFLRNRGKAREIARVSIKLFRSEKSMRDFSRMRFSKCDLRNPLEKESSAILSIKTLSEWWLRVQGIIFGWDFYLFSKEN